MTEYEPSTEDLTCYQTAQEDTSPNCVKQILHWQDPDHKLSSIQRAEILDCGDECFLLHGTLSDLECRHYIDRSEEQGLEPIVEAKSSYRGNTRLIFQSESLCDTLWSRILPHLETMNIVGDPHDVHIHGPQALLQGTWTPLKLNNMWRVGRYYAGGHFAPHFDGHFVESDKVRSLKTFMVYLNGPLDGGSTNLVNEKQRLYMDSSGKYCAEEKNILYRISPAAGTALIFNHHRLHEGEALRSGVKYILRTDIMYQRTSGPDIDPVESEALRLAQEAERLEASGDAMVAMEMYRKAFKMSRSLAASYGCDT